MQSLFDPITYEQTVARITALNTSSTPKWGKMNVAQMLAHMNEAFTVPLQVKKHKRMPLGYIFGPFLRKKLYDNSVIGKNIPTAPSFKIVDERAFEQERTNLLAHIEAFFKKREIGIGSVIHPFFGKLTPAQWGMGMYKHLDHHLQQFDV